MLDLYLSEKAFIDCCTIDNHPISKLIREKRNKPNFINIKAGDYQFEQDLNDPQSVAFIKAQQNAFVIQSGSQLSKRILDKAKGNNSKINGGLGCSMFVLNGVTPEMTLALKKKCGVICLSDSNPDYSQYAHSYPSNSFRYGEDGCWNDILSEIATLPLNSLLICDRFLKTNDSAKLDGETYFPNLQEILSELIKGKGLETPVSIIFLFIYKEPRFRLTRDEERNDIITRDIENIINPCIKSIDAISSKSKIAFKVEFIFGSEGNNELEALNSAAHDRFIISNYSFIYATKSLAAFSNSKAKESIQTIAALSSLELVNYRKMHHDYRGIISDIIQNNKDSERSGIQCYKYNTANNHGVEHIALNKISNNLVMEFPCYYLSVPPDNDWANIKILEDTYRKSDYANCVWSRNLHELEIIKKDITALFSESAGYSQVLKDDAEQFPFYRVYVNGQSNLRTVDYKEVSKGQEEVNNHKYNCFRNEKDAEEVVKKIKEIIGCRTEDDI